MTIIDKPPAIFLMGPTASGKTDLAVALCDRLPCDIISVDSVLVYRGMDIGTAKPGAEVLAKAPHRLIDIRDPSESYSVAEFRADALNEMANITDRGRIPLLVGGTMLYFKVLLEGLAELPPADELLRLSIYEQAAHEGWPAVHRRLAEVDPISAARIHPTDPQRLSRALEVFLLTGKTITELRLQQARAQAQGPGFPYKIQSIAVAPVERKVLHERIARRFNGMIESGFIDEVRGLFDRGDLDRKLPAMRAVGYRQVWDYIIGELNSDSVVKDSVIATRQLAKRQLTWLRSWPDLVWLDCLSPVLVDETMKVILSYGLRQV